MTVLPPLPLNLRDQNLGTTVCSAMSPISSVSPVSPISPPSDEVDKAEFVVNSNAVADEVRSMRSLTRASKRRSALFLSNVSAVDTLKEEDLRAKLKDAMEALKEKERDLTLAAEIGQQLVAANNSLMAEYQELVNKTKAQQAYRQQQQPGSRTPTGSVRHLTKKTSRGSLVSLRSFTSSASSDTIAPAAESATSSSATSPHLSRRRSTATLEYINSLERANTDLRAQLDVLEANLRDAERMHRNSITNLRRSNASLQEQLRATLHDLRDAEASHTRAVSSLERDLEQLRMELQTTALAAAELEEDRRRLLREQAEVRRDTKEIEQTDQQIIQDLQSKLKEVEAENAKLSVGKKESERRSTMHRIELEELTVLAKDLEAKAEETDVLREECARQFRVIEELHQQLEDMRAIELEHLEEELAFGEHTDELQQRSEVLENVVEQDGHTPSGALVRNEQNWEWTKWIERTRTRCWEIDIAGLKEEIADLRAHREEAYSRLRASLQSCTKTVVKRTPKPVASLASMATSVVTTVVPSPVVGLVSSVARGVQSGFERRVLGVKASAEKKN